MYRRKKIEKNSKKCAKSNVADNVVRLLVFAEDRTKIRYQDFFSVVKYLSLNPVARPHMWTWARINWQRLVSRCVRVANALQKSTTLSELACGVFTCLNGDDTCQLAYCSLRFMPLHQMNWIDSQNGFAVMTAP